VSPSEGTAPHAARPDFHDVPARFDAAFVLGCSPERLGELAAPASAEPWLVAFAAWLRERGAIRAAPPSRRAADPRGFPDGSFPLLSVRRGEGELALVRIAGRGGPLVATPEPVAAGDADFDAATRHALAAVAATAAPFLPEARQPVVRFETVEGAYLSGSSAALAVALLAWSELLGVPLPDDLVATACLAAGNGSVRFVPVDPATLPAKFAVARRWGYRRIALVEGQEVPAACAGLLEIHRVPADPARLLPGVLPLLGGGERAAEAALAALLLVDLSSDGDTGAEAIRPIVAPFLAERRDGIEVPPSLRLVAHDLLSRHLLHDGATAEAERHHRTAESLVGHGDRPPGILGDKLLYERAAHAAIVALDRGEFGESVPEHAEVDRRLGELERIWCSRHQRLMRIFLRHARAWRLGFRGRLERDAETLRAAWAARIGGRPEWPELLERYARQLGRRDTSIERAEGELLELAHAFTLAGVPLPDDASATLASFGAGRGEPPDPGFPLLAWLRRRATIGPAPDAGERAGIAASLLALPDPWFFPVTRCAELLLASDELDAEARRALATRLAASELFRPDRAGDDSILRVLSLRAATIIATCGGIAAPAPLRPRPGTPLERLFDRLAAEPASIVARCPY